MPHGRPQRAREDGALPRPLSTDGVPAGADPEVNEIGLLRPGGQPRPLLPGCRLYYNGIVRIGRFDGAIDSIADQPDGITVTVDEA